MENSIPQNPTNNQEVNETAKKEWIKPEMTDMEIMNGGANAMDGVESAS